MVELKDHAIIICEQCEAIIGISYNCKDYDLMHDCFCIKCHNENYTKG